VVNTLLTQTNRLNVAKVIEYGERFAMLQNP
jgi:hypothetical protein